MTLNFGILDDLKRTYDDLTFTFTYDHIADICIEMKMYSHSGRTTGLYVKQSGFSPGL